MNMRRYEAVLFDWDDTLCYGEPHYLDHTQTVARRLQVEVTRQDVHDAYLRSARDGMLEPEEFYARLAHALGIADEHHEAFREGVIDRDAVRAIFDGVRHVIDGLSKRDLKIGLLSNNVHVALRAEALNIQHHFDVIVSPYTYGVHKPDPKIFIETLAVMGVEPERAIYVGDSYNDDVVGARAAGMTPVLIDRYELTIDGHDAEHRIETLDALEEVLERLLAS